MGRICKFDYAPDQLRRLHQYWSCLKGGLAPERIMFNPAAVKLLLPCVLVADLDCDPFRVSYRLTGTKVDEMTGLNLTGRCLEDFLNGEFGESVEWIEHLYRIARESGKPAATTYAWPLSNGEVAPVWLGVFPLMVYGQLKQCVAIEDYVEVPIGNVLVSW